MTSFVTQKASAAFKKLKSKTKKVIRSARKKLRAAKQSLNNATQESIVVTTPEGLQIIVIEPLEQTSMHCAQQTGKFKNNKKLIKKNNDNIEKIIEEDVKWASHYFRHRPPLNVLWEDIVKSTIHGPAKYKPGINIKELELYAWKHGKKVTIPGKSWKVFKYNHTIGANAGKETCYIRVECSANTIHGHPILEADYIWYST